MLSRSQARLNATVFLCFSGNGDGTFQSAVNTPYTITLMALQWPWETLTATASLMWLLPASLARRNQVDILLGNGDGTFRPIGHYDVSLSPHSIAAADFNEDKKADLAVGIFEGGSIVFSSGMATERFKDHSSMSLGSQYRLLLGTSTVTAYRTWRWQTPDQPGILFACTGQRIA